MCDVRSELPLIVPGANGQEFKILLIYFTLIIKCLEYTCDNVVREKARVMIDTSIEHNIMLAVVLYPQTARSITLIPRNTYQKDHLR